MYKLQYKTDKNDTVQEVNYLSLYELTQQVISDFNTMVLTNIDQLVSVTYEGKQGAISVMVTVLENLRYCVNDEVKDQIKFKLIYLKDGV